MVVRCDLHLYRLSRDEANDFAGDILDIVQAIWDDVPEPEPMVAEVQDWIDGKVDTPNDRDLRLMKDGEIEMVMRKQLKPIIR